MGKDKVVHPLEEVPDCLKEGLVIPVYKKQGKDHLLPSSYLGITLLSVVSKLLEIILVQQLSPLLEEQGFPDQLQTAYQKGISCMDAIFATQETLLHHLKGTIMQLKIFFSHILRASPPYTRCSGDKPSGPPDLPSFMAFIAASISSTQISVSRSFSLLPYVLSSR